jgi:putative membrane protein
MTFFMLATQRMLPRGQRYALPPEMITKEFAHRAHIRFHLTKKQILAATLFSHFGYGTAVGALYRPLERRTSLPAPVKGTLFGLLVWLVSYFVLLPLLRVPASGQKEPGRRNLMMVLAHTVWGATLGTLAATLSPQKHSAPQ